MKYQLTFKEFITEAINPERITELKTKISNLAKRLTLEADPERKKNLEKQIKVNKLRLMIAQIG